MISTSSPTLTMPRSMRPVTTVPRPEIENTSSIGIRNGWSIGTVRLGDVLVHRLHQVKDRFMAELGLLAFERRQRAEPRTIGISSPGNW